MEASRKNQLKAVPQDATVLGTLPPNQQITYSDQSESNVSNRDKGAEHESSSTDCVSLESESVPKPSGDHETQRPKLVTVKGLARLYGLNMGAVYAFIKTEPDFPYINVGVKKKFMVDVAQFETWLAERTKKQKHEHFAIPSAVDLVTAFKSKAHGGNK